MPISYITAASLDGTQNGSAPIYGARAWVNFNGTGTVAIRASGNVSSITDNGTGDYTANFTIAMADANYSVAGASAYSSTPADGASAARYVSLSTQAAPTTTSVRFITAFQNGGKDDNLIVCLNVFR